MRSKTLVVQELLGTHKLETVAGARELISNIDGNIGIVLDFSGIEYISEAFAQEVFVNCVKSDPRITLNVVRASDAVEAAIRRVMKVQ